jgi:hypothetical protein
VWTTKTKDKKPLLSIVVHGVKQKGLDRRFIHFQLVRQGERNGMSVTLHNALYGMEYRNRPDYRC